MNGRGLLQSLTPALVLTMSLLWLLDNTPRIAHADPVTRYVATFGTDTGDCTSLKNPCRTIQYAIDAADPDDEIWVAGGIYTDTAATVADIDQTVTLLGGWDDTFAIRDPDTYTTTLDAQGLGRVVEITGYISPTIDGFTITGGNANDEVTRAGYGAGIYSWDASPVISSSVIISNVASISPTVGYGGGIFMSGASTTTVISGNQVVSNTASTGPYGWGGGLYLSYSDVTIRGTLILSNTCSRYGGGVYVYRGSPWLVDNEIQTNVAGRNSGGIHLQESSAVIEDNLILDNRAGWDGTGWNGGGIMAIYGSPTISANRIYSNSAAGCAGLALETGEYFTVVNNYIAHNDDGGIKLWELTRYGLVANNTLAFNAGDDGGILLGYADITPTIVNNIIVSNSYGIQAHADASGTIDYNDVWGNDTDYDLPGALEPGSHDIQADPLFLDPEGLDFHIPADSPAVNAGTFDGAPDADYDGDARPHDCFIDIGADENTGSYECLSVSLPLALKRE